MPPQLRRIAGLFAVLVKGFAPPPRAAMRRLAALTALILLAAAPAAAQRAELAEAGRDWLAVGRLEIGQDSFCTVTLVAPDRALTAAHCVVDDRTGRMHRAERIAVLLGYANGRAEVERGVRAITLSDAQAPGRPVDPETTLARVATDVALLTLDRPVRLPGLEPIALGRPGREPGHRLTVVSYARGRDQRAALQDDCLLINARSDGALVLDCEVDHGASGAPVMDLSGGAPQIVAVISARGRMVLPGFPEADVALAAPLNGPGGAAFASAVAAGGPRPGAVRVRRAGQTGDATPEGPRILRPGGGAAAPGPMMR
jgi:V8-like Glu-specific endopeptidase